MEKIEELKCNVIKLLHRDDPIVLTIKGEWGSGKTCLWREIEKEIKTQKKCAYISLFGLETISDIRRSVLLKVSAISKSIDGFRKKIKGVKGAFGLKNDDADISISGVPFDALLSMFEPKDFRNIVICFDDIERMSNKLDINDFLGLVAEFKEQKECKVVVILNEDELSDKVKAAFSQKKEKIFDRQFLFQASVEWAFEKLESTYPHKDVALHYFKELGIRNIRIMKLVANVLVDFAFVDELPIDNLTKQNFFYTLTSMATVYHKFDVTDFQEIQIDPEYLKKIGGRSGDDIDNEKQVDKKYIDAYRYYYCHNNKQGYSLLENIRFYIKPYFFTFSLDLEQISKLLMESYSNVSASKESL